MNIIIYIIFDIWIICVLCCAKSIQSCLTPCDPMYHSPPGSSIHGIYQARILELVAMPFSRGFPPSRDGTHISWFRALAGRFFTTSATWEAYIYTYPEIPWCLSLLIETQDCLIQQEKCQGSESPISSPNAL